MKYHSILATILITSLSNFVFSEYIPRFQLPKSIIKATNCSVSSKAINELNQSKDFGWFTSPPSGAISAKPVFEGNEIIENNKSKYSFFDMNQDNICEVFGYTSRETRDGDGSAVGYIDWVTIYQLQGMKYVPIGGFDNFMSAKLLEPEHGYYQILYSQRYFDEMMTTVQISSFKDDKFQPIIKSNLSYGRMTEIGLEQYKKGDFKNAEKWFWNSYIAPITPSTPDTSNLALAYIKLNKYSNAIEIINKQIKYKNNRFSRTEGANIYYNLAIAYSRIDDFENAINSLEKSIKFKKTTSKINKLNKWKKIIQDDLAETL